MYTEFPEVREWYVNQEDAYACHVAVGDRVESSGPHGDDERFGKVFEIDHEMLLIGVSHDSGRIAYYGFGLVRKA